MRDDKEYHKIWWAKHKDVQNLKRREYRKNNLEKIRALRKKYDDQNREKVREQSRKHYHKNRDKIRKIMRDKYPIDRQRILAFQKKYYTINRQKKLEYQKRYGTNVFPTLKKIPSAFYYRISYRAKVKNQIICSKADFVEWFLKQPHNCVYCEMPFREQTNYLTTNEMRQFRISVDRKDSSKGYTTDNMVLSCIFCNVAKNSLLSFDEMKLVGQELKKIWIARGYFNRDLNPNSVESKVLNSVVALHL